MKIPTRLAELLAKDNGLNSLVLKALTIVEPWASDNKTVFFPEYTDHSLKHLEDVLLTADGLIRDDSWPLLTAEDAAVTVLSVLLHDCALHLSEDGFFALTKGAYQPAESKYVSQEASWPLLWDNFLLEAKRFDQRRLFSIFGDTTPISLPPSNRLELTFRHRLLIGEFLRRHHARLAHEIAISGIPGPQQPIQLVDPAYQQIADLAGFVARSHNMSLRSAVDRLEAPKRRIHLNCKVPFVMAILRLADYLQIHAARAPGQLLQLKTLVSPISRGEWKKHSSVVEINQAHDDPEAIFVDADPDSAGIFLAMRRLLADIQLELDHCWAVLGEIYGRFAKLEGLGIGIRRIRSNLDNPAEFQKISRPAYIPWDFRFKTASAELLDLLVAPLYGAKPEIGIRELVQNAVDACLERDDLVVKNLVNPISVSKEDVFVLLSRDESGAGTLIVEDHGVGMTPEVVDKYFLNVGASFRSSDLWRKNHESAGHSTVHRTGRFGIGLLAAFLLGPEITVTTRHVGEPEDSGVTFTCSQGDESLEVKHCKFHHGTRIEIALNEPTTDALLKSPENWDWYCLAKPTVRRSAPLITEGDLPQEQMVPACDEIVDGTHWRRISAEGFDDVFWSYEAFERWEHLIVCNGIRICKGRWGVSPSISPKNGVIRVYRPSLVVYDPDGRFPINLQRDSLSAQHVSFADELSADVARYISKRLFDTFDPLVPTITVFSVALSLDPNIPGLCTDRDQGSQPAIMILSKDGVVPADADLMREAGISCLLIDATNMSANRGAFGCPTILDWATWYCAIGSISNTKSSRTQFIRSAIGDTSAYMDPAYFSGMNIVGRRLLVRNSDIAELVRPANVPRRIWNRLTAETSLGEWTLYRLGDVPPLTLDLSAAVSELDKQQAFGFAILYFDLEAIATHETAVPTASLLATAWRELVGSPILRQRRR